VFRRFRGGKLSIIVDDDKQWYYICVVIYLYSWLMLALEARVWYVTI